MQELSLLAVANQSLTVDLDSGQFTLTIKEAGGGVMVADVVLDGVTLIAGTRILAGEPILPYGYLQAGNFVMSTIGGALPYWDQFGSTQALYYLTDDEMS